MNFLSHVAVVEPMRDPLVLAGSVLPDILRHVGSGHHRKPDPVPGVSAASSKVLQGIQYHIESDAFFHYCPWFASTLKNLQEAMAQERNPLAEHWARWLLPHVLIEIILDAHLAESRPDLPKLLYTSLREFARRDCCAEIARLYEADAEHLRKLIEILCSNRRVETYNTTAGVADALRRVLAREGKEVICPAEEPLLDFPIAWIKARLRTGPDVIRIVREGIRLT